MKQREIQVQFLPLTQLLTLQKQDFENLTQFQHYKKNQIYQYREQCLSKFIGYSISAKDIVTTEYGKPYLKSDSFIEFNQAHSHQYYALAMSHQVKDLGVDVEDLNRKVRFEALAKHAFHADELKIWQSLDFDPVYWFKVWTTKEAILKASGLGIRMNLNELNTQVHVANDGGISAYHERLGIFAYQNYQVAGCVLTVAWRSELSCRGFAFPIIHIQQNNV